MIKVAIVGNIASGKSTVSEYITMSGYKVLDTDLVAHNLLNENMSALVSLFSEFNILDDNNTKISREKLGKLVFNNKEAKTILEDFIHPLIKNEIIKFFEKNQNESLTFVAIPLLFEAKMEYLFDKILFIYCNDDIRFKRLIKRNNYSEDYARIRMQSQISQDEKIKKSDYIIYNNSTTNTLKKEISAFLKKEII